MAQSQVAQRRLSTYSVEKLPDRAFSIVSGARQTINLTTRVAYTRFWRVGFLIHPLTRHRNRVFQQNRPIAAPSRGPNSRARATQPRLAGRRAARGARLKPDVRHRAH